MISEKRAEKIVDALGELLGIDTGTMHEDKFEQAVRVVYEEANRSVSRGFATVKREGLQVSVMYGGDLKERESQACVRTAEELEDWCDKWDVEVFSCSSSVDFPEEDTDDELVIELCKILRG